MRNTIVNNLRHRSRDSTANLPGRRAHDGQALIEFAMVGLILLTMSLGVIEFGRAFSASIAVTHASRDGARLAMNPAVTDAEIIAAAQAAADPYVLTDVQISRSTVVGEMSTITVTYEFEAVTPLVANLWGGGPLTISDSSTSRVGWK
jgi:Flp pilus assembly protein TadG